MPCPPVIVAVKERKEMIVDGGMSPIGFESEDHTGAFPMKPQGISTNCPHIASDHSAFFHFKCTARKLRDQPSAGSFPQIRSLC